MRGVSSSLGCWREAVTDRTPRVVLGRRLIFGSMALGVVVLVCFLVYAQVEATNLRDTIRLTGGLTFTIAAFSLPARWKLWYEAGYRWQASWVRSWAIPIALVGGVVFALTYLR